MLKRLFGKAHCDEHLEDRLYNLLGRAVYNNIRMLVSTWQDSEIYKHLSTVNVRTQNSVTFSVPKLDKLFDNLRVCFNTRILDFRGGNGLMAALIANQYNVKCVDVCDLHDGTNIVKSTNTRYTQMRYIDVLPYRNNTFDIVSCFMIPYVMTKYMVELLFRVTKKWLIVYEYSKSTRSKYLLKTMDVMNKNVYKFTKTSTVVNDWVELTKGKFILTKKCKKLNYPVPVFIYVFKKVEELDIEKLNKLVTPNGRKGN